MLDISSLLGVEEMKDYATVFRQVFAEFLGTFLYLSIALSVDSRSVTGTVHNALAHGLLVASIVQIIGHVSGGHVNPAVTLGVLVAGQIKVLKAICYILAQIFGGILGAVIAHMVVEPGSSDDLNAISPEQSLKIHRLLALEIIMTFVVVAVALSVFDTTRGGRGLGSSALAIGLSVSACHFSVYPSSWSVNPVRTLAAAVLVNSWVLHWLYWVAPFAGAILAGLIYRFILAVGPNMVEVLGT